MNTSADTTQLETKRTVSLPGPCAHARPVAGAADDAGGPRGRGAEKGGRGAEKEGAGND